MSKMSTFENYLQLDTSTINNTLTLVENTESPSGTAWLIPSKNIRVFPSGNRGVTSDDTLYDPYASVFTEENLQNIPDTSLQDSYIVYPKNATEMFQAESASKISFNFRGWLLTVLINNEYKYADLYDKYFYVYLPTIKEEYLPSDDTEPKIISYKILGGFAESLTTLDNKIGNCTEPYFYGLIMSDTQLNFKNNITSDVCELHLKKCVQDKMVFPYPDAKCWFHIDPYYIKEESLTLKKFEPRFFEEMSIESNGMTLTLSNDKETSLPKIELTGDSLDCAYQAKTLNYPYRTKNKIPVYINEPKLNECTGSWISGETPTSCESYVNIETNQSASYSYVTKQFVNLEGKALNVGNDTKPAIIKKVSFTEDWGLETQENSIKHYFGKNDPFAILEDLIVSFTDYIEETKTLTLLITNNRQEPYRIIAGEASFEIAASRKEQPYSITAGENLKINFTTTDNKDLGYEMRIVKVKQLVRDDITYTYPENTVLYEMVVPEKDNYKLNINGWAASSMFFADITEGTTYANEEENRQYYSDRKITPLDIGNAFCPLTYKKTNSAKSFESLYAKTSNTDDNQLEVDTIGTADYSDTFWDIKTDNKNMGNIYNPVTFRYDEKLKKYVIKETNLSEKYDVDIYDWEDENTIGTCQARYGYYFSSLNSNKKVLTPITLGDIKTPITITPETHTPEIPSKSNVFGRNLPIYVRLNTDIAQFGSSSKITIFKDFNDHNIMLKYNSNTCKYDIEELTVGSFVINPDAVITNYYDSLDNEDDEGNPILSSGYYYYNSATNSLVAASSKSANARIDLKDCKTVPTSVAKKVTDEVSSNTKIISFNSQLGIICSTYGNSDKLQQFSMTRYKNSGKIFVPSNNINYSLYPYYAKSAAGTEYSLISII